MELTDYVNSANWPTELDPAKEFAREAVSKWIWKDKAPDFLVKIDNARTIHQLQEIVIYPILSGEGNAVLKR